MCYVKLQLSIYCMENEGGGAWWHSGNTLNIHLWDQS